MGNESRRISPLAYLHSLVYPWDNAILFFWFLPTLFIVFIFAVFALKYTKGPGIAILVGLSLLFNIFHWEITPLLNLTGVACYFLWWGAGFHFAARQEKIIQIMRLNNGWICVILFLLTIFQVVWPVEIVKSAIGILFSISLGLCYDRNKYRFLNHLFGYSFSIYLLSWFPQVVVRIVGFQMYAVPWPLVWCVSMGLGIYIPYLIAKSIKTRWPEKKLLRILVGV